MDRIRDLGRLHHRHRDDHPAGSLIGAMVLHGLWDVSVFAVGHAPLGAPVAALLAPVILALAVVYWVIKGTDEGTGSVASSDTAATAAA